MSDKYIQIQNFKYGVDSRRSELTSQPGTLVRCENAHVNHGGEIEKRKGFFKNKYTFPTNTFGFEYTAAGLVTFGSDAAPNAALPNGVTYIRLQSPSGAAMTSVPFSCNFQGSAFVIATFSDGVSLCFYGGTLVNDSWNGRVLTGHSSLAQLAIDLAAQINLLPGWNAVPNIDSSGIPLNGSVMVKSPAGITFVPTITVNSALGVLGSLNLDDTPTQLAGIPTTRAIVAFAIDDTSNGTNGTYTLKAPFPTPTSPVVVLANAVVRQSSNSSTANAIAAAVNASTILYGYSAAILYIGGANHTANIYILAPEAYGATINTKVLTIVTTGDVSYTTATAVGPLSIAVRPKPINDIGYAPKGGFFSINANLIINGGTPPYIVTWATQFAGSNNGIAFNSPIVGAGNLYFQATSQFNYCTFSMTLLGPVTIINGQFQVTVTDSTVPTPQTATLAFPVTLTNASVPTG